MDASIKWPEMPKEIVAILERAKVIKKYKRGDYLYQAGDQPAGVFYINQGLVGLVAVGVSGNQHLLRLFKTGQFHGHRSLLAQQPYHANAIALEETQIAFVPKETVMDLIRQFPEIAFRLLETLARELGHAEMQRVSISEREVQARVAEAVVFLKDLYPDHDWTRKEIAEFCGSTTPTVIRTLARFEAEGLIRQEGRMIEVLNRAQLLELALGK